MTPDQPAPDPANWTCTIGEVPRSELDRYRATGTHASSALRHAVEETWERLFGSPADYTFDGFGSPLPERYRAVHENDDPDPLLILAEARREREIALGGLPGRNHPPRMDPLDIVAWIQRHIGEGTPADWSVEDYVGLATIQLGRAIEALHEEESGPDDPRRVDSIVDRRAHGRECLLTAAAVLVDAAEAFGG